MSRLRLLLHYLEIERRELRRMSIFFLPSEELMVHRQLLNQTRPTEQRALRSKRVPLRRLLTTQNVTISRLGDPHITNFLQDAVSISSQTFENHSRFISEAETNLLWSLRITRPCFSKSTHSFVLRFVHIKQQILRFVHLKK